MAQTPAELSGLPIKVMEPAIIERLRIVFPAQFFTIERVPQTLTLKEFDRVIRQTPFIGLAWTGYRPDSDNGRSLLGYMQWRLFLVYRASNTLETRFKGDALGIGLDPMTDLAMTIMQGVTFNDIGHSTVTGANAIHADGHSDTGTVLSQVDFQIRFSQSAAGLKLGTPDDFAKLAVTWLNADSTDVADGPQLSSEITLNEGNP